MEYELLFVDGDDKSVQRLLQRNQQIFKLNIKSRQVSPAQMPKLGVNVAFNAIFTGSLEFMMDRIGYWATSTDIIPCVETFYYNNECGSCRIIKAKIKSSDFMNAHFRQKVVKLTRDRKVPAYVVTICGEDSIDDAFMHFASRADFNPMNEIFLDSEGFWLMGRPYVLSRKGREYIVRTDEIVYDESGNATSMAYSDGRRRTYLTKDKELHRYFMVFDFEMSKKLNVDDLYIEGRPLKPQFFKDNFGMENYRDRHLLGDDLNSELYPRFADKAASGAFSNLKIIVPPPGSKSSIFMLEDGTGDIKQLFSNAKVHRIPAGTELFHGGFVQRLENRPLWLATDYEIAAGYGNVNIYRTKKDLVLYSMVPENIKALHDKYSAIEADTTKIHRVDDIHQFADSVMASAFPAVVYNGKIDYKRNSLRDVDLVMSALICMSGYDGYYAEDFPDITSNRFNEAFMHPELMLCSPADVLEEVFE